MAVGADMVPHSPPSSVVPWHSSRPEAPRAPTGVRATWVGHSTVLLELGGLRVLTDPLLRRRLGPLRRRRDLPVQHHVEDVDAVLLSHLHHDHADLPSLRRVGHVPVVTDPANLPWLDKHDARAR